MIASITGKLHRKSADYLIINVSGIGYQVFVPLSTFCSLPDTGEEVSLHIHTHLREESLSLFGFLSESEKEMFLLLMGVSGIGPKLALAVLSSIPVADLCSALQSGEDSRLCTVPGVGKKTAARMVLELKDRTGRLFKDIPSDQLSVPGQDAIQDAVSALVNLGYKKPMAEEAVKKVLQAQPDAGIEFVIRAGLNILMK